MVAAGCPVEFSVPPDFEELEIGATDDRIRDIVQERLAGQHMPDGVAEALLMSYEHAAHALHTAGAFYAGTCLGLIDGDPSSASLVLAATPMDGRDSRTVASGIVQISTARHGEKCAAQVWELPCGPAAVVAQPQLAVFVPGEYAESGTDEATFVAQAQAWIPVPRHRTMVTATLSTPSTDHWDHYCEVFTALLRSLRFGDDEQTADRGTPAAPPSPSSPPPSPPTGAEVPGNPFG
ncbi:hypothetical protein ACFY12_03830 [Streptomyces sp. NPDC001339]|uniref:hypothetical protein n=1 Tax=Streptomyces sp. NPDC001339 TaxID=3364563 RepID=UPI00368A234D